MDRRSFLAALAVVASQVRPAVAGRELNNQMGRYDGTYVGKCKIIKPDTPDKIIDRIKFDLAERYANLYFEDRNVHARIDQIYSFGYKTEVMCHHVEVDERFIVTTEQAFND